MFERLFTRPTALARHRAGPLVQERIAYLAHLEDLGLSTGTLQHVASSLLVITHFLRLADRPDEAIGIEEVERKAALWLRKRGTTVHHGVGCRSLEPYLSHATRWLRFLGRLKLPPAPVSAYDELIKTFADYMRHERGLSSQTIRGRCWFVRRFLDRFASADGSLRRITIAQIDEVFLGMVNGEGYARNSVQTWANSLRAFFRYAEMRGWCHAGLAAAIQSPRVFSQTSLPTGPSWDQVRQMLATTEGDRPVDIRDRVILLLLVIYGLRAGEVRHLRLEDFD